MPEVLKQCSISTILVFVNQLVGLLLGFLLKDFSYRTPESNRVGYCSLLYSIFLGLATCSPCLPHCRVSRLPLHWFPLPKDKRDTGALWGERGEGVESPEPKNPRNEKIPTPKREENVHIIIR